MNCSSRRIQKEKKTSHFSLFCNWSSDFCGFGC